MWKGQRIGVVVPAYNEGLRIADTLKSIPEFVDRIFLVDDASDDNTSSAAKAAAQPRLVRIRHASNRGVGAAIVSGYERAIREHLDVVCVMAGDGQMEPADLTRLLEATSHSDYVKGNRFLHAQQRHMPLARRWGSRYLSWLTRLTTGLAVDDCQCGYTALRVESAARLPLGELWPRYGYPNDLLALLGATGALVSEVPVAPRYRGEASGLHAGHVFSISARIVARYLRQRQTLSQSGR